MSNESTYCVYCHTNKINGKRYVGVTCKSPNERWHNGKRYDHNQHFFHSIEKYGWDGFTHDILHTNLSKEEAFYYERKYIKEWNLRDSRFGYNMTDGGEGCCGRNVTQETRKKIAASLTGVKRHPLSKEHRQKISKALIGVPHPHKSGKRKPFTTEQRKHVSDGHKIPVAMYSKDGNFIRTFPSSKEGAQFAGLKYSGDICKCCKGQRKTAGGFSWRYVNDQ